MGNGKVLDLFCGVGGVARGFDRLGYETVGFDIEPQPKYPHEFHRQNLKEGLPSWVYETEWDGVWASPPCTFAVGVHAFRKGENLIPLARELVESIDAGFTVIKNVPGAKEHLRDPVILEGGAFGLEVRKRRCFETNFRAESKRSGKTEYEHCIYDREHPVESYREAHGFPCDCELGSKQLREAIPPAYVEYLEIQARKKPVSMQATL